MYRGRCATHPSTLHMDGTSPVVVHVQATTDELRDLHRSTVVVLTVDEYEAMVGEAAAMRSQSVRDAQELRDSAATILRLRQRLQG